MNILRFLSLSLLIASGATSIHGSEAHTTRFDEESDEFFSLSCSDTELEVEENKNTQSSYPTSGNTPENTKSDLPSDNLFRKTYSSLWKDASLGQKVSEVVLVGLCTSGIAYRYSESFRKKVDTCYKKINDRIKQGYKPVEQPLTPSETVPSAHVEPEADILQNRPAGVMGEELTISTGTLELS